MSSNFLHRRLDELSEPSGAGAAAVSGEFRWPSPPYYELVPPEGGPGSSEGLLLILRDGTRAGGRLCRFLPNEGCLTYQPEAEEEPVNVPFSTLLRLQFLEPARLRPDAPKLSRETLGVQRLQAQPFLLELVNGEKFQGMTVGYVSAVCGLFLYLPADIGGVVCVFVPAQAAKSRSVGAPLGQMLIEQKAVSPEAVGAALNMQAMMRTHKFGEFLTANKFISTDQLAAALAYKRERPDLKLGEALTDLGYMGRAELAMALGDDARERSMSIGEILLKKMGAVDEGTLNEAMANKLAVPRVNLNKLSIAPEIIRKVPAAVAGSLRAVPLLEAEDGLVVALENATDQAALERLRTIAGMEILPVSASRQEIVRSLKKYYGYAAHAATLASAVPGQNRDAGGAQLGLELPAAKEASVQKLISRLAAETGNSDVAEQQAAKSDSALVKLVNRIILDAVEQKASDIHIEANHGPKATQIRFRKDGGLVNYLELPAQFRTAVISRIKIMSQLDITERRKPQDGKIDFGRFGPAPVELRVATVPTSSGLEDVVMRVLAAAKPVPLGDLGLEPEALGSIKRLMARPHGLFLVCGPTGSGKTTTLHSLLAFINTSERKIWTAEDPIEITQPGLRQVQVNAKIGWTFAAAMRSFMRADPDVIMVGEMRDAETAKIAIEASLTGHLVLSTLHTNSAPESIVRLLDLGMDPFNFADALLGVLGQRLARRLCPECKLAYTPTDSQLEELAQQYRDGTPITAGTQIDSWRSRYGAGGKLSLFRASGCERCDGAGYKGRIALYELLVANPEVKGLVQTRAEIIKVKNAAIAAGMRTLRQDGIEKILQGLTDVQQVSAVAG